jgi:hypothetical protein
MPAQYTANHLRTAAKRDMVFHDPDSADLELVDLDPTGDAECLPIKEYRRFLFGLLIAGSATPSDVDGFEIIAATDDDGTGATVVVTDTFGATPDATGDVVWLECDVEQVREVLATATHIGVRVEFADAASECTIYYELAHPFYPRAGLTADRVA